MRSALVVLLCCLLLTCAVRAQDTDEDEDFSRVTCGSVIKLKHIPTTHRLHSHKVNYGTGSGQQSVTGFSDAADSNSLWLVKGSFGGTKCPQGTPIHDGDLIRLEHVNTAKYLHSHYHQSPLSGQQEVSAYVGNDGRGDTGDNWKVEINGGGAWKRGEPVRLLHVDTNKYLHSHNQKFGSPIAGQTEITCAYNIGQRHPNIHWTAEEGIYFPSTSKK